MIDLFDAKTLTDAINEIPVVGGKILEMGLFTTKPVSTSTVVIENKNGVLKLLENKSYGAPAQVVGGYKRARRAYSVLHFPLEAHISPEDIRSILAFGSEQALEMMTDYLASRLADIKANHDVTREFLMLGAIKGYIKDGTENIVYDLYTDFGITQNIVDLQLSVSTTNVKAKCSEIIKLVRKNLKGDVMSGVHCFVSSELFDAIIDHPSVKEVWLRWADSQSMLGGDVFDKFPFMGITFERYDLSVTNAYENGEVNFFSVSEGIAFPVGTRNTFVEYVAPADFNETINMTGKPYYVKMEEAKFGRGYDIHAQSNILPMCTRPSCVVRVIST